MYPTQTRPAITDRTHLPRGATELPGQTILRHFAAAFFTFALIADLAYLGTFLVMWQDIASWMLFAGLVCAGLAVLLWLVSLALYRPRPDWPRLALHALVILLALLNSLFHAGDGWTAIVPWGVTLSAATVLLMIAAAALARLRETRPLTEG